MDREQGRFDHHPRCPITPVGFPRRVVAWAVRRAQVPRPPHRPLRRGRFVPATALAVLMALPLLGVGCAGWVPKRELISTQPGGTRVERITGFPAPRQAPQVLPLRAPDLERSLLRITVRYHGVISFSKDAPQPLLTPDQAAAFAALLAEHLPTLAPNQRLRFSFRDARKGNLNEMDVYPDGPWVVYHFNVLVGNPKLAMNPGDPPFSEADLEELPGQKTWHAGSEWVVRDAVTGSQESLAANVAGALALIDRNHKDGLLNGEEAERLRAIAHARPEIQVETWRLFLEKRATLKRAREQGLMSETAYQTQMEKIGRELAP